MTKKKASSPPGENGGLDDYIAATSSSPPSNATVTEPTPTPIATKKTSKSPKAIASTHASAPLNICRNKHWRFISSFHGPWLQLPAELLYTIANINYNTPSPRPIDPAVLFDIVKIRQNVDEATNLAVRAASDTSQHASFNRSMPQSNTFGQGGPGHGQKLSRERKFRMRELASQRLARAYRLDEIICSVATMQCSSPVEDVGGLVLQRSPQDTNAKYVHFFHEKIPSRQVAESTSLQPLTDIISERPGEPEVLRTRAIVKGFKDDYEGAAQDLTHALSVCRFIQGSHVSSEDKLQLQEPQYAKRRSQDVILPEAEQPSSLHGQLLFQRAGVYLTMACQYVEDGTAGPSPQSGQPDAAGNGGAEREGKLESRDPDLPESDKESLRRQTESRKLVKIFAKRALRDYMGFISQFEYSPNIPTRVVKEFSDRMNFLVHGVRSPRVADAGSPIEPHTVYSLSELFSAVPPSDLPPYPSQEVSIRGGPDSFPASDNTCEWRTFHPLLAEALHSLLLCHCLAQTSVKELQRHAYMVARLVRLSDGLPVFQASRSPARSDWVEVLRRAENWLQLSGSWEALCAPAPLPTHDSPSGEKQKPGPSAQRAALAAASLLHGANAEAAEEERRRAVALEQAIKDSLNDDRVTDEASFRASIQAREKRAEADRKMGADGTSYIEAPLVRRPSSDEAKDYPILTERASSVAQWVCDAPVVTGTARRKKRSKKATRTEGIEDAVGGLELDESMVA